MKKATKVLILIILFSFISSCQNKPVTWITNNTCSPPCWNGITPGETQLPQALESLKSNPEIAPATVRSMGSWYIFNDEIIWSFRTGGNGRLYILDDTVSMISLNLQGMMEFGGMEFEEAVQIFGTPEFIYNSPAQGDFVWYNIFVIYPQRGILFGYSETKIKRYMRAEIRPDIPLGFIMFYDPERYEEYIDAELLSFALPAKAFLEGLQPWNGYGKINEKYPSLITP